MKTLSFDQFEFERPDAEEHLEIAVSKITDFPHPTVASFVASVVSVDASKSLPNPKPFNERFGYGLVRRYLERHAGILLPSPCAWPTYVLTEADQEFHAILSGPDHFISYSWSTSA